MTKVSAALAVILVLGLDIQPSKTQSRIFSWISRGKSSKPHGDGSMSGGASVISTSESMFR